MLPMQRTQDMANIDPLLRRNKDFAATGAHEAASIVAKYPVYVITCLDPRTDPSAFLRLELGDAMVIRNAGGRVTPGVVKDLAYIGYLSHTLVPGGPRFEVAVVHHNQCGTHFLADENFRRGFADLIGGDDAALAAEAVTDPEKTVRFDVELLRSATVLPDTITVSGHVYDVTTGLVTTIVPAAQMHPRASSQPSRSPVSSSNTADRTGTTT
jgi:carbonic anhydrase